MNTRFYITYGPRTDATEFATFDSRDAKGRQIGCMIERGTAEFTAEPTREYCAFCYDRWLGTAYTACVEATRNGVRYGSSQRTSHFRTVAEREAFIAKRVEASRKAALKKAA